VVTAFPKPVKKAKTPKPLKRGSYMKRKRARRIDRKTEAEKAWLAHIHVEGARSGVCEAWRWWMSSLDVTDGHVCIRPFEAAHIRDMTGLSRKESDLETILLCKPIHEQYDQANGLFAGWPKTTRKEWFRARLADARARATSREP
jgi:hypothetical protein